MPTVQRVPIDVNGVRVDAEPSDTLLRVLREQLELTGAKPACGEGACGACSVLAGDRVVRSCVTTVAAVAGEPVTTIEGIATGGLLHAVQRAFLDAQALQCGYCTPGMIVAAVGLLRTSPEPTEARIVAHLQGHVCRCGCYPRIVAAVADAARAMHEAADG